MKEESVGCEWIQPGAVQDEIFNIIKRYNDWKSLRRFVPFELEPHALLHNKRRCLNAPKTRKQLNDVLYVLPSTQC